MQCYFIYSMSKSLCHLDFFIFLKLKLNNQQLLQSNRNNSTPLIIWNRYYFLTGRNKHSTFILISFTLLQMLF